MRTIINKIQIQLKHCSSAGNWSGGSSVDNHEEELVQYFQHQPEISEHETETENDEKLSQLRQLLAKNLNQSGEN